MRRGVNPALGVFLLCKSGSLICDAMIGISDEAAHRGWPLNFYFGAVDDFRVFLSRMSRQKNMGVIAYHNMLSGELNDSCEDLIAQYCSRGGKLVCLNYYFPGASPVAENVSLLRFGDYQGGIKAAQFLHSQECSQYLSFELGTDYCFQKRVAGFSDYCQQNAFPCQVFPAEVLDGEWSERYHAVMARIEPHLRASARLGVFIPSDHVLLSCAGVLTKRGYKLGEDVHLVGYDDSEFACFQPWPFATLKQDFQKEGRLAVELLAELLAGESGRAVELQSELITWNYPASESNNGI